MCTTIRVTESLLSDMLDFRDRSYSHITASFFHKSPPVPETQSQLLTQSQLELSALAGLSVPGISLAENGGRVRLSTLIRLAAALSVPRDALVRLPPPDGEVEEKIDKGTVHAQV